MDLRREQGWSKAQGQSSRQPRNYRPIGHGTAVVEITAISIASRAELRHHGILGAARQDVEVLTQHTGISCRRRRETIFKQFTARCASCIMAELSFPAS